MDIVSSPFPEHSDPVWLSPLLPLEVKLLVWSPRCCFALLSQLPSISIHCISRMFSFA